LICDATFTLKDATPEEAAYDGTVWNHKGISLDGLPIMSGANSNDDDPLCVKDCKVLPGIDLCMGHTAPSGGAYHYHAFSPCAYDDTILKEELTFCRDVRICSRDPVGYAISHT